MANALTNPVGFPYLGTNGLPSNPADVDTGGGSGSYSRATGTGNGTSGPFTVPTYTIGNNSLLVFVDGLLMTVGVDYLESSTTLITFLTGSFPASGANLSFIVTSAVSPASTVQRGATQADGVATVFTVPFSYIANNTNLEVYQDGVLLSPVTVGTQTPDYTETDTTHVTFAVAPPNGAEIIFIAPLSAASSSAGWNKYTVTFSQLATAATTNNITLFSLPAKNIVEQVVIKHSTSFTGGGITAYTVSVGPAGNLTEYASAFDVFQAVASNTAEISSSGFVEDFSSATAIKIAATSTGANLNAATAGSVDVWVQTSVLP